MGWIKELTGFTTSQLLIVVAIIGILNIKNIVDAINSFKSKKIKFDDFSDYEKMMYEGEKALTDCKAIIERNIPDAFNMIQKWVLKMMLFKAFTGACKLHIRGLVSRNGFGSMSPERFLNYCEEETPRVLRAVSDDLTEEWEGKEKFFPISREDYEKHNYENCAKECGEIVTSWFKFCRSVKLKEKGVI